MIVRCLSPKVIPYRLPRTKTEANGEPRTQHDLVPGREYVVFGLGFYENQVWVEVESDAGFLYSVPLEEFSVVEPTVSRLWHVLIDSDNAARLLPPEFSSPFFHGDLADREPEALRTFASVRRQILEEAARHRDG